MKLLDNKRILVTSIGSHSAETVIRSLKELGAFVIGIDIYDRKWLANSADVDLFYNVPRATDSKRYKSVLHSLCTKNDVSYVLPLTDLEIDSLNYDRKWFDRHGIKLCISPIDAIKKCRNKEILYRFVKENIKEINAIETCYLKDFKCKKIKYPIILKPYNGRSSNGVYVVRNRKEWNNIIYSLNPSDYIVQPYIDGSIITVDIVSGKNDVVTIAREELIRTSNGAGLSVKVFQNKKIEKNCKKLAKLLCIVGCVNFEFIKAKNGKFYLMDCNPRFSSGIAFSCISGYDVVKNHIMAFDGYDIDEFILNKTLYIARRYSEVITKH